MAKVERMRMLTDEGERVLDVVVGSQAASMIGGHRNAIKAFRDRGDASLIARYRGVSIGRQTDTGFEPVATFASDPQAIKKWVKQGEVDDDGPYVDPNEDG